MKKIMTEKTLTKKRKAKNNVLDEILYETKRLRAGLTVMGDLDGAKTCTYGYLELLQLSFLYADRIEAFVNDMNGLIQGLEGAGAKDYETPA